MAESICNPGANPVIEQYFKDCIYDTRDWIGFIFGLCSILCWLVAQVPQLVINYKLQSAEALSPFFLAEWLCGDAANLIGALLKGDQPQTLVLTAEYFLCMDCVLLVQYMYYTSVARRRERSYALARRRSHRHHRHHRHQHRHRQQTGLLDEGGGGEEGSGVVQGSPIDTLSEEISPDIQQQQQQQQHSQEKEEMREETAGDNQVASGSSQGSSSQQNRTLSKVLGTALVGTLLVSSQAPQRLYSSLLLAPLKLTAGAETALPPPELRQTVGTAFGFLSCGLYLMSRLSQIYKNFQRRSAEGLAFGMFACAVAANLFYGTALILRSRSAEELLSSLPWLVGSLGTVGLDVVILTQSVLYGAEERKRRADEEEPLLQTAEEH